MLNWNATNHLLESNEAYSKPYSKLLFISVPLDKVNL